MVAVEYGFIVKSDSFVGFVAQLFVFEVFFEFLVVVVESMVSVSSIFVCRSLPVAVVGARHR